MDDDELREMIGKAPLFLETGKDLVCHPCPTTFVEINKKTNWFRSVRFRFSGMHQC